MVFIEKKLVYFKNLGNLFTLLNVIRESKKSVGIYKFF